MDNAFHILVHSSLYVYHWKIRHLRRRVIRDRGEIEIAFNGTHTHTHTERLIANEKQTDTLVLPFRASSDWVRVHGSLLRTLPTSHQHLRFSSNSGPSLVPATIQRKTTAMMLCWGREGKARPSLSRCCQQVQPRVKAGSAREAYHCTNLGFL